MGGRGIGGGGIGGSDLTVGALAVVLAVVPLVAARAPESRAPLGWASATPASAGSVTSVIPVDGALSTVPCGALRRRRRHRRRLIPASEQDERGAERGARDERGRAGHGKKRNRCPRGCSCLMRTRLLRSHCRRFYRASHARVALLL